MTKDLIQNNSRIKFDKFITSKGLKILNFYDPDTKRVGIEFITKASTCVNPEGKEGLAHFVEHMLVKHTNKYPTEIKFAKEFEKIGAKFNASTYPYKTLVYITGGAVDFEKIVGLLHQSICDFKLTDRAVNSEIKVIEKEIIRKMTHEGSLSYELLNTIMLDQGPLKLGNLGRQNTIENITSDDIRKFVDNNYLANNSVIVIWGGIESKKAFELVKKHFDKLPNKKWSDPEYKFSRETPFVLSSRKSDQVTFQLAFRLPNDLNQVYKTNILRKIMCSGFSSRLVIRLRVKESLIYGWSAHSETGSDRAGIFFEFSTSRDKFIETLTIISDEIGKFKKKGVTKAEFHHAVNNIVKPFSWGMETVGEYAGWYVNQELFWPENVESPQDYIKNLKAVTPDEVVDHAKEYLTSNNWFLSAVGGIKKTSTRELQQILRFE